MLGAHAIPRDEDEEVQLQTQQLAHVKSLLGYENGVGPGNLGSNLNVIFEEAMFLHDIQYFKQNS